MSTRQAHTSRTIGIVGRFHQSLAIAELLRKVQHIDESAIQIVVEPEHKVVTLHDIFDPQASVHLHGMEADNFLTSTRKLAQKSGLNYRDAQKAAAYDYRQLMANAAEVKAAQPFRMRRAG
ncbi:hypothetical protein [Marinobacter sp.]|uniref:hypothetical protein n=1 Tax=Marinobacter sp. TaxID=50741 RepID=UPI0035655B25